MRITVIWEHGVFRPMHSIPNLPEHTELEVVLPEVEIDEKEMARRRTVGDLHRRLQPIDIRPLTTEGIVREDRESR
jgi:predicted DNA-binding antitoxin AbrB/MazE fold protein